MPRLPSAEDLGQRPTPAAKGGISPLRLSTPRMGLEAQAEIEFGKAIKGVGDTLGLLALKEKQDLDEGMGEESSSAYYSALLDFQHGEKNGYDKILGGAAVKQPLLEMYTEKRKVAGDKIRATLTNDTQRGFFDKRRAIMDRQFDAGLYVHTSKQSQVYHGTTLEGTLDTQRQGAVLNWERPGTIEMSILNSNMAIERFGRTKGLDMNDPEDAAYLDAQKREAESKIHVDVVGQMLLSDKDAAAEAYLKQIKERLTPDAIANLGSKVDMATTNGEAIRTSAAVWEAFKPRNKDDVAREDIMAEALREQLADKPKVLDIALRDMKTRVDEYRDGVDQNMALNLSKVYASNNKGESFDTIKSTKEFQDLPPAAQNIARDYIIGRGRSNQAYQRNEDAFQEKAKGDRAWLLYHKLSDPKVLVGMSPEQIEAVTPFLGTQLTRDLFNAKRKLDSPESIKEAFIDNDLFNTGVIRAEMDPFTKDDKEKMRLGMLRNEIEAVIAIAQKGGKVLQREEKETIMQKVIDRRVIDTTRVNESFPSVTIFPDQLDDIYTPIKEIDPIWMEAALNHIRSVENIPAETSDLMLQNLRSGRLERAFAVSISNGTIEQVNEILEGRD